MNDQQLDQNLAKIVGNLNAELPAATGSLLAAAQARYALLHKTAAALQESLESLRMNVKYLVFDLEATRRENALLKRELDALRGGDRNAGDDVH